MPRTRADSGLNLAIADARYLKLDCTNDPLTNELNISMPTGSSGNVVALRIDANELGAQVNDASSVSWFTTVGGAGEVARYGINSLIGGYGLSINLFLSGVGLSELWETDTYGNHIFNAIGNVTDYTASTEFPFVDFDSDVTKNWATGNITNQREFIMRAPTYTFDGASTVDNTATLYIDNAPQAGLNATLTNVYALWVDMGDVRFDENVKIGDGSAATPAVHFNSDTNSGIYSVANGTLGLSAGGVLELSISSGEVVVSGNLTIGLGAATTDYTLTFNGETKDGVVTWMEDEGYWDLSHPIVISDQTLQATPVAGAIEFDNDRLYITNVALQRAISRSACVETSTTTVTNTTDETTIYTCPNAANSLKVGNHLHVECTGIITNATAADDITIKLYVGAALISTYNPAMGNVAGADWHADLDTTIRTAGASGTMASHGHVEIDGGEVATNELDSIDTTAANDITVTVQWDNAKAGNIISLYQGVSHWHN